MKTKRLPDDQAIWNVLDARTRDILFTGDLFDCQRFWRCARRRTVIRRAVNN